MQATNYLVFARIFSQIANDLTQPFPREHKAYTARKEADRKRSILMCGNLGKIQGGWKSEPLAVLYIIFMGFYYAIFIIFWLPCGLPKTNELRGNIQVLKHVKKLLLCLTIQYTIIPIWVNAKVNEEPQILFYFIFAFQRLLRPTLPALIFQFLNFRIQMAKIRRWLGRDKAFIVVSFTV